MNPKNPNRRSRPRHQRRGAITVLVAISLVIFMVALVFSIDVAFMQLTRTELRTTIDASARAAAESLSRIQDVELARQAAIDIAKENRVAGKEFTLPGGDIQFGRVVVTPDGSSTFDTSISPPNAVQIVSGRTTGRPDGPVDLFLGRILGTDKFEPVQSATAAQLDRDIALVLDVSGSMKGSKFSALQTAVEVFFQELEKTPQTEHVAIIVYDTNAEKVVDLTDDVDEARDAFSSIKTRSNTAIGRGLEMGIKSLKEDDLRREFAEATIVVMTDGKHNTGISPEQAIKQAPNSFKIHTVTFGSGAEKKRMKKLAKTGNGKSFHAPNNSKLVAIFREIGATLPVVLTE